jgi:hypothetical protein
MATEAKARVTTQKYEIYIKASAEAIWDAITDPAWTARYGYQSPMASSRSRGPAVGAGS